MTTLALLVFLSQTPAPSLQLEGDLVKPSSFTAKDLAALSTTNVEWSDKQGKHTATGVRLDTLLLERGFSEGAKGPAVNPKQKHPGLRAVVIATANDGFMAVFSVGELLGTLGTTNAVLIWEMDGKPLPPEFAPFRLVVTTDKAGSRSIYQLAKLRVLDLADKK
ncbi:MAG: molybdopterin-dependent oxidoreductase [Archangium sp.]